jgi:phosphotriesterase-related protein
MLQGAQVETVLGKIPASELGAVDAHTHLSRVSGPLVDSDTEFLLNNPEHAVAELTRYRAAGGSAVVEVTPCAPGRTPDVLAEISEAAAVHVVATTGFVDWALYPGTLSWLEAASVEELVDLLVAEVEEGMDVNNYAAPYVRRSTHRAGVIKVSAGYKVVTPLQHKILEASAHAHLRTGKPITVHTEKGTSGLEIVGGLADLGVDPSAIMLGHTFLDPDPVYQHDLAQTGAYLIQDGPGRMKYFPESNTVEQIRRFVEAGFLDQLLFAGDHSKRTYWKSFDGWMGFDYILTHFVPLLHRSGIGEDVTHAMLVGNAAKALRIRERKG